MAVTWSYASFAFFVVPYYLVQAGEKINFYLMNICLAISETIASIILLAVVEKMNLKRGLIVFNFISLVGTISILLI
jgi:hypothetical protein